jgi:hypothetical protein
VPPDASYDGFVRQVRRYRQESVLRACAEIGALRVHAEHAGRPFRAPNYVTPFALAAIAHAALVSGTPHRTAVADQRAVHRLCGVFAEVDDPDLGSGPTGPIRGMLTRLAYQQFGFGGSVHDEAARSVGLLLEHAPRVPGAPAPSEWEHALGMPLETYMRVVFAVFVAAVQNPASVTRTLLRMDHVAPVFDPATTDQAMDVIDRWLTAPVEAHRAWAVERAVPGRGLWSPNPLQHRPLVAIGDELVVPVPEYLLGRMSPSGLWFTGLDEFGTRFTDALGTAVETYVGEQLSLIRAATVHPEVVYDSPQRKTVDWFVVTDDAVVLVEVKAARPAVGVRTGSVGGDEQLLERIGKARSQIDRTAALLANGHPAVAHIPSDRALRGLVVTLEPFHMVDTFLFEGVLPATSIPTATASVHDVETVCAALADSPDAGRLLLAALTAKPPAPPALRDALEGLPRARNPLLDRWWQQWSGDA